MIGALSPAFAARLLIDRFQRPGRPRQLDAVDVATLDRARPGRLVVGDDTLQTYAWGPDAAPAVLLMHGWGSHAPRWSGFVDAFLARGWRVLAFDAPAHGRSTGKRSNLLRFRAALEACDAQTPISAVVAHSFGALSVAHWLGDGHGTRIRAAALLSTPCDAGYLLELYFDMVDANARVRDAVLRRFEAEFRATPADFSALTNAARVNVPVLVVHDADDEAIPPEHGERLASALPRATLVRTQGLGHNRLLRDAATIDTVATFVSRAAPLT